MIAAFAIGSLDHQYLKKRIAWRRAITFTAPLSDYLCSIFDAPADPIPTRHFEIKSSKFENPF